MQKHALGRKSIKTKMERAYRSAEKHYNRATQESAAGNCFLAARADSDGSAKIGAADAYARAGRFSAEGGATQEKAWSAAWRSQDSFSKHCRAAGPLSGVRRRR